jgi:membrane-associated phospholipid phosphatase
MKTPSNRTFLGALAFIISAIFSPYITALVFIIIVVYNSSQDISEFIPWMITFLLFSIIIPGVYVMWEVENGGISDLHISNKEERKIPFLIAGVSAIIGTIILFYMNAARPVIVMAVTYSINAVIVAIITQYWKISIHTALFSSVATVAFILYGPAYLWLYLILIPLIWSRVYRKRHTLLQATAGALLAFVTTIAVFWAFGYI